MIGLLDLLNRALRQGKTAEIAESYRPVFKLFLTIFDLRRVHPKSLSVEVSILTSLTRTVLKSFMRRTIGYQRY
jgi:hypothetical protein